jgi:hypothetical protein
MCVQLCSLFEPHVEPCMRAASSETVAPFLGVQNVSALQFVATVTVTCTKKSSGKK